MKKIPKYVISIDDQYSEGENLGWSKTAFTSKPAIVIKGMAFTSEEPIQLSFRDDLKYRIAAPAMVPSTIYRNMDGEEFYVEFTEKEIEKIHMKFMKNFSKNKGLFNLEHSAEEEVPAYLLECWLVEDPEKDKSFSSYGIKVPKGSLFLVAQITDKEYYKFLVENEQTGFSIEGFMGLALSEHNKEEKTQTKMENELMLPDGEHTIGEKIYVIKDGKLVEIKDIVKDVEMSEEKPEVIAEEKVELAEEVVTEEVVAPVEETPAVEYYSKEEVDAKFDELYAIIAELKTEKAEEIVEDKIEEEMKFSASQKLINGFATFKQLTK